MPNEIDNGGNPNGNGEEMLYAPRTEQKLITVPEQDDRPVLTGQDNSLLDRDRQMEQQEITQKTLDDHTFLEELTLGLSPEYLAHGKSYTSALNSELQLICKMQLPAIRRRSADLVRTGYSYENLMKRSSGYANLVMFSGIFGMEKRFDAWDKVKKGKAEQSVLDREFAQESKGWAGFKARYLDYRRMKKRRKELNNDQITIYHLRYIDRASDYEKGLQREFEATMKDFPQYADEESMTKAKRLRVFMGADAKYRDSNMRLVSDMLSGEKERMSPHLQGMLSEILRTDIAWGMLNKHYLADHAEDIRAILERCRVFGELTGEGGEASWFLEELPGPVQKLVADKINAARIFGNALRLRMERQGIDPDTLEIKRNFHAEKGQVKSERETDNALLAEREKFFGQMAEMSDHMKEMAALDVEEHAKKREEKERTRSSTDQAYRDAKQLMEELRTSETDTYSLSRFRSLLKRFAEEARDNRSGIDQQFAMCAKAHLELTERLDHDYEQVPLEEQINSLLRLSHAAHAYLDDHGIAPDYGNAFSTRSGEHHLYVLRTAKMVDDQIKTLMNRSGQIKSRPEEEELDRSKGKTLPKLNDQERRLLIVDMNHLSQAISDWKKEEGANFAQTPEKKLIKIKQLYDTYRDTIVRYRLHKDEIKVKDLHWGFGLGWYKTFLYDKTLSSRSQKEIMEGVHRQYGQILQYEDHIDSELALIRWGRQVGDKNRIQHSQLDEMIDRHLEIIDDKKEIRRVTDREDESLLKSQLDAINQIDRWVMRNMFDGGLLRSIGTLTRINASQLVMKLMSLTKRERLFIYYLVETRERIDPEESSLKNSQDPNVYLPDLGKFRGRMHKSKWNMISRLTGNYIYWEKIQQAMEICNGTQQNLIELVRDQEEERKQQKDWEDLSDGQQEEQEEEWEDLSGEQQEEAHEVPELGQQGDIVRDKDIRTVNEKEKEPQIKMKLLPKPDPEYLKKVQEMGEALANKTAEFQNLYKTCQETGTVEEHADDLKKLSDEAQEMFRNICISEQERMNSFEEEEKRRKQLQKMNAGKEKADLISTIGTETGIGKITKGLPVLAEKGSSFEAFGKRTSASVSSAVSMAASIMTLYNQIGKLYRDSSQMSYMNIFDSVTEVSKGIMSVVKDGISGVEGVMNAVTTVSENLHTIAGVAGFVTASAGIAINVVSSVTQLNQFKHARRAHSYLDQKYKDKDADQISEREKKFDQNMMKLNDKFRALKGITTAVSSVSNGVALTSLCIPVCGTAISLVATGISLGATAIDILGNGKLLDTMFDDFFEVEKLMPAALATQRGWTVEEKGGKVMFLDEAGKYHEKQELRGVNEDEVRASLRNQIAARYGYATPRLACTMIANKYATFIHDKLFGGTEEDISYYKELVAAFGLRYEPAGGGQEGKPSIAILTKKMLGR